MHTPFTLNVSYRSRRYRVPFFFLAPVALNALRRVATACDVSNFEIVQVDPHSAIVLAHCADDAEEFPCAVLSGSSIGRVVQQLNMADANASQD